MIKSINFGGMCESVNKWVFSLSERSLSVVSIVVLHSVFIPQIWAYNNALTDKLPNFDAYFLVLFSLLCMNMRAIIKKDSILCAVHMIGFCVQLTLIAFTFLK